MCLVLRGRDVRKTKDLYRTVARSINTRTRSTIRASWLIIVWPEGQLNYPALRWRAGRFVSLGAPLDLDSLLPSPLLEIAISISRWPDAVFLGFSSKRTFVIDRFWRKAAIH
jgi:hypothetical protein